VKILSFFAPFRVEAFCFACFAFCRGRLTATLRRHETIHYQQQVELFFVFHWFLYLAFYAIGFTKHFSFSKAYKENPFEKEAYDNQSKVLFLDERPLFNWKNYV
jgi:hypothetical protein